MLIVNRCLTCKTFQFVIHSFLHIQEKSQSIPTNQPSSVLLATITKPIVQYSTATSHSLFNFPALGQS